MRTTFKEPPLDVVQCVSESKVTVKRNFEYRETGSKVQ